MDAIDNIYNRIEERKAKDKIRKEKRAEQNKRYYQKHKEELRAKRMQLYFNMTEEERKATIINNRKNNKAYYDRVKDTPEWKAKIKKKNKNNKQYHAEYYAKHRTETLEKQRAIRRERREAIEKYGMVI